jgi:hypothetical protein
MAAAGTWAGLAVRQRGTLRGSGDNAGPLRWMYNVRMRRYTAAQARSRLADALNQAEAGQPVVIERRGVRFQLTRVSPSPRPHRGRPLLEIVDPAVERGEWTWQLGRTGARFTARRRRR